MNIIAASVKDESAESLARKMLAEATGEKPENIVFYRGENGKPLTRLPLFFNCSHSGDHVVCAVSKKEIGVDLERIRPVHERMERALSEAERRWRLVGTARRRSARPFVYTAGGNEVLRVRGVLVQAGTPSPAAGDQSPRSSAIALISASRR